MKVIVKKTARKVMETVVGLTVTDDIVPNADVVKENNCVKFQIFWYLINEVYMMRKSYRNFIKLLTCMH